MGITANISEFGKYSTEDKLLLIEELWDSIPDDPGSLEVPQAHKDELDRRLAAMEADPLVGSSWDEVKARLQAPSGDLR